ncbi:flavonoid 3'-monooxygenase [Ranunculus cassubicifolius]
MAPSLEILIPTFIIATLLYLLFNLRTFFSKRSPLPPGPKPWPILGNLPHMGPAPHHSLAAMKEKYGPLMHMRLGYVHVVIAQSANVAAQFLKINDLNFSNRPPNSGAKYVAYNYQDMVFAPYGAKWRMLRKICYVHLFSAKALDDFCHVRQEEVAVLTNALLKSGPSPSNLGQLLTVCITNALARVVLGQKVFNDGSGDKNSDDFKQMITELLVVAGVFNLGDFIPALEWLDLQGVASKLKKIRKRFDEFLDNCIDKHNTKIKNDEVGGSGKNMDFLSTMIGLKENADGEGEKLTDNNIKALLVNLFTAGTDTSSSTIEWAIAELIRHPNILVKAVAEIDSVVGKDRLVQETDLNQLPYLQAIIKETFRLHPSTPLSLPRMATEDCEINGYFIPKNSTLLVNVWAISRDPEKWPEPLEFRPERFLPGSEHAHIDIKGNDFEVIPFGAGRRICAGMSLGIRMVTFVTASLIHSFDWVLPDGLMVEKLNMEEAYGLGLQKKVPLMVHPCPRLASHAYQNNAAS